MTDRCMFCDQPATRLCDAGIGLVYGETVKRRGKPPYRVTTMAAMQAHSWTCDAPFCSKHGHKVGHICGRNPDTIDHCDGCVAADRGNGRCVVLNPDEIDAIRRQWHAEYRRARIASVEIPTRRTDP